MLEFDMVFGQGERISWLGGSLYWPRCLKVAARWIVKLTHGYDGSGWRDRKDSLMLS